MPKAGPTDSLIATRDLVVLLRLTARLDGRILYGEVVDPETRRGHPFRGLAGISGALRQWIAAAATSQRTTPDDDLNHVDAPHLGTSNRVTNAEPEDPCLPS